MKRDIAKFDTSDYPIDNMYGMFLANKKVSDERMMKTMAQ